jgi:predicted AAA+ superfamily ATPase
LNFQFVVHLVYPHHRNFGKRLVKTPKMFFYDTGLSKWLSLAGTSAGTPYLVYGGNEDQVRSGVRVVSWKNLPALVKALG